MLKVGIVSELQWCDTRDMTADGHTKGTIDRKLLKELMSGYQSFQHKTQTYIPFRGNATSTKPHMFGGLAWLPW